MFSLFLARKENRHQQKEFMQRVSYSVCILGLNSICLIDIEHMTEQFLINSIMSAMLFSNLKTNTSFFLTRMARIHSLKFYNLLMNILLSQLNEH